MARIFLLVGSVCGLLAVGFGAFGAHALKKRLAASMLETFHTAAQYQMYHALALLSIGVLLVVRPQAHSALIGAGWAFTAGIVIFCGSLYGYSLTGTKALAMITPIGGVCFIAGWALLCLGCFKTF